MPTSGEIEAWASIWRSGAYRVQQREEVLAGSVKVGVLVEGREVLAGRGGVQQVQLSWPRQHAPAGVSARPLTVVQGCTSSTPLGAPNVLPALRPGKSRRHSCWGISISSRTEHAAMAALHMQQWQLLTSMPFPCHRA